MFQGNDFGIFLMLSTILGIISYYGTFISGVLLFILCKYVKCYKYNTNYDEQSSEALYKYIEKTYYFASNNVFIRKNLRPSGFIVSFSNYYIAFVEIDYKNENVNYDIAYYGNILNLKQIKNGDNKSGNSDDDGNSDNDNNNKIIDYKKNSKRTITIYQKANRTCLYPPFDTHVLEIFGKPRKFQRDIINIIKAQYINSLSKSKIFTILISGSSGIGKSMICKFLTYELSGVMTFSYNMLDCGDALTCLHKYYAKPTADKPLIVQLDEFDKVIDYIHDDNRIKKTNMDLLSYDLYDKSSYNVFMTEKLNLMKYVIYIMTTNKPFEYFDEMDPSYIAKHRINMKIAIENKKIKFY